MVGMVYEKLAQYGPLPIRILAGVVFITHGIPSFPTYQVQNTSFQI
jgi:uncharacterized membrane protein YphA (DoxX/SURF4 family)